MLPSRLDGIAGHPSKAIPYRQLPIVIQDKIFIGSDSPSADPTWTGSRRTPGSLWYAHTYDPKLYALRAGGRLGPEPEELAAARSFRGAGVLRRHDAGQRHGLPEATVQPTRYRLRILNACNARFLNLQLYVKDSTRRHHANSYAVFRPMRKGPDFYRSEVRAASCLRQYYSVQRAVQPR